MAHRVFFASLMLVLATFLSGCAKPANNKEPQAATPSGDLTPEQIEAYAQLPSAERAVAQKQAICPVSNEKLGTMGAPYKVTVKGQDGKERVVYLCCKGCEEDVLKDPDQYLAKLPK